MHEQPGFSQQAHDIEQRRNAELAADPYKRALTAAMIAREQGDQVALDALRKGHLPLGWDSQLAPYLNGMQQVANATVNRNTGAGEFNGFASANKRQPTAVAELGDRYQSVMGGDLEQTRVMRPAGAEESTRNLHGTGFREDPLEQNRALSAGTVRRATGNAGFGGQHETRDLSVRPEAGGSRRSLLASRYAGSGLLGALGARAAGGGASQASATEPRPAGAHRRPEAEAHDEPTQLISPIGGAALGGRHRAPDDGPTVVMPSLGGVDEKTAVIKPAPANAGSWGGSSYESGLPLSEKPGAIHGVGAAAEVTRRMDAQTDRYGERTQVIHTTTPVAAEQPAHLPAQPYPGEQSALIPMQRQ